MPRWTAGKDWRLFNSKNSLQCTSVLNVPNKQPSPAERKHPHSIVVNISSRQLSPVEVKLLSKGINLCPSSGNVNEFELYQDLDNSARNLHLQKYFHGRPAESKKLLSGPSGKMWTHQMSDGISTANYTFRPHKKT